jgi:hypothetical protein
MGDTGVYCRMVYTEALGTRLGPDLAEQLAREAPAMKDSEHVLNLLLLICGVVLVFVGDDAALLAFGMILAVIVNADGELS